MLQDCPEHFACDITESSAGAAPERIFACLPVVEFEPRPVGAACDGFPEGQCARGSSCIPAGTPDAFANCLALCDQQNPESCPKPQICSKPDFFPADPPFVGVCTN